MIAPPRCAKCAILSQLKFATPIVMLKIIKKGIKYFAFIGIGGISDIIIVLGKSTANPDNKPHIAPDAPIVGPRQERSILITDWSVIANGVFSFKKMFFV